MGFLESFFVFDNLPPSAAAQYAGSDTAGKTWVARGRGQVEEMTYHRYITLPLMELPAEDVWLQGVAQDLVLLAATDKRIHTVETIEDAKRMVQVRTSFDVSTDYNVETRAGPGGDVVVFIGHRGAGRWCIRGEQTAIGLIAPEEVYAFELRAPEAYVEWPSRFDREVL